MEAFSVFSKLWQDKNNPFAYLFGIKDDKGTPLYEPYPSPPRFPLISVSRKSVKLRPYQNFSIHRFRHVNWPTVSDTGTNSVYGRNQTGIDLTQCDLGNVTVQSMPIAFDYRFQIDHWCLRPDNQALFLEKLIRQFWRGGPNMQTWLPVTYPGWGLQRVRLYVEGDEIDHHSPEEADAQDKNVEFRTTFNIVIEGFSVDLNYQVLPALWHIKSASAEPQELDGLFYPAYDIDLRITGENPVLTARANIPSSGTCGEDLRSIGSGDTLTISLGDPLVQEDPADNSTYVPLYSHGIAPGGGVGTPTITVTPIPDIFPILGETGEIIAGEADDTYIALETA
jgi:hypothetical protein